MTNVPEASRAELEVAVLESDELASHLGGIGAVRAMSVEELREKITAWISEGDETA